MRKKSLRQRIATEAAKLLVEGRETDYTTAKRRAARYLGIRFSLDDFPSTREIQKALRQMERLADGGKQSTSARDLHLAALRLMRPLKGFAARLVQPLVGEEVRTGLETTIALAGASTATVCQVLEGISTRPIEVETSKGMTAGRGVLLLPGEFPTKILLFEDPAHLPAGATFEELQRALTVEGMELDFEVEGVDATPDRFLLLEDILAALEEIRLDAGTHPEGDALHHALQLFDLTRAEAPYDEELLSAALFHDVGALGTTSDRIRQTETLLDRLVTRRTLRLIEALVLLTEEIPAYAARDLTLDEGDLTDARRLADLDRQARAAGVATTSAVEAIDYLRRLEADEWWDDDSTGGGSVGS